MSRVFVDLSHTAHTRARTGIQRVARSLYTALARQDHAMGITWDPYADRWRELADWERANLGSTDPSTTRGAKWPWSARVRGYAHRSLRRTASLPASRGLLVPELFSPAVARAFPHLGTTVPRVAIFHDAIALKFPELTPPRTVARYPSYLQELLDFNGIAAVSEDSRQTLLDYWRWLGIAQTPPVTTIPLGLDVCYALRGKPTVGAAPVVLCVGSIEGRKNHLALLAACERLWATQRHFSLRLIGLAHPQTGQAALKKISALQTAGHPLRYDGAVDEATLESAYAESTFTVYPSLMEGFGLPVLESLARGKPCICSAHGALGEAALPGGCVTLERADATSLADAIDQLLQNPAEQTRLATDARNRSFRTWDRYANDLLAWMKTLG